MRKTYCNRVLSSYFSCLRYLSLIQLVLLSSRPVRSGVLRSVRSLHAAAPFRSLFRVCTLCYPANINGAERTIQRRTVQSMNDDTVRDVQRPWWLFLSNAPLPPFLCLRARLSRGHTVSAYWPHRTLFFCSVHVHALTHSHFRASLTPTPRPPPSSSPSIYSPLLPSSGMRYSRCVRRQVRSTHEKQVPRRKNSMCNVFFYLFRKVGFRNFSMTSRTPKRTASQFFTRRTSCRSNVAITLH